MFEPAFQEAMLASRQGASEMARGDYQKSIQAFRRAIVSLKRTVDSDMPLPCLQSWRLTTMPIPNTQQLAESDTNACAVFDRCFLLMPMPCHEKIPSNDKVALVSAALLFNIALAYQLQAARSSLTPLSSVHNGTAMRLYNRASQVLQGHLEGTSDGAALMLAVSNNMAALALEQLDLTAFATHRTKMGKYLTVTSMTGTFHSNFFAGNFAATDDVHKRPAPAAWQHISVDEHPSSPLQDVFAELSASITSCV